MSSIIKDSYIRKMLRRHISRSYHLGLLALFLIYFCPVIAYAHPPKDIQLNYDLEEQTLMVMITHSTLSSTVHYIKTIEIKNKFKVLKTEEYTSQPDQDVFTYTYKIPMEDGDELEIKATCSIFGSKTATVSIISPPK